MTLNSDLYQIADQLRATANLGLQFGQTEYDLERYRIILAASARLIAAIEARDPEEVLLMFEDNLNHFSPLIGAEGVVLRDEKILLIQRKDNGLWAVPGGLSDVGETLAETALRELLEETGIHARISKLLGIFDSRIWKTQSKSHLYHTIFLVETDDDQPTPDPLEALDAAYFAEDDLPSLSPGHRLRVPFLFKLLRGEIPTPYFDPGPENSE